MRIDRTRVINADNSKGFNLGRGVTEGGEEVRDVRVIQSLVLSSQKKVESALYILFKNRHDRKPKLGVDHTVANNIR